MLASDNIKNLELIGVNADSLGKAAMYGLYCIGYTVRRIYQCVSVELFDELLCDITYV